MSLSPLDPKSGRRRSHWRPVLKRMALSIAFFSALFFVSFGVTVALAAPGDSCKTKQCRDHIKIEVREKWRKEVRQSGYAGWLKSLRHCESTNNYKAVSAGGTYRGAYQFDGRTWREAGGVGHVQSLWGQPWADPAEQDVRTVRLAKRVGKGRWPVCG